jgi:hypothetical protein
MTAMLRRISDRTSAGLAVVGKRASDRAGGVYDTALDNPKATTAIMVGTAVFATAVWALIHYRPRTLSRRSAAARIPAESHAVRRRRVRAGRAATA